MATRAEPRVDGAAAPGALAQTSVRAIALTLLAAMVLAVLTVALFTQAPRYQKPGRPLLENADFRAGFDGWDIAGLVTLDEHELGRVILQNRDPEQTVHLRQTIALPPGWTSVRLSADLATSRVQLGRQPWQAARVYLAPADPDGHYARVQPGRLAHVIGTTERRTYARTMALPGAVTHAVLAVELPGTTGNIEVANLELALVEERPEFRLAAALLVTAWALLAFWVGARLDRSLGPIIRGWLMTTLVVGLIALWLPAAIRQGVIAGLASTVGLRLAQPDAFALALVFGLVALLLRIGRPRDSLLVHVACWLLAAAVTEVWQLLTAGGAPALTSWLTHALGAALGLGFAEITLALDRLRGGPLTEATRADDEP